MRPSCLALPKSCAAEIPKNNETLSTVQRTTVDLIPVSLLVDVVQKSFSLQFDHHAGVDEIAPIALFFNLHEVEKYRRIFRSRVGNSGKYLQPKIVSLLKNLRIVFLEIFGQDAGTELPVGTK